MKNKKDRGCYAVGKFFERFRSEKCRLMTTKVVECVKSKLAGKRKKDGSQLRPCRALCVQRCMKKRNNP